MDSEYSPLISLTHNQTKNPFRIKHTIKSPNLFVIDKTFYEYITDHNKKYNLFLAKCDFKLIFNNDLSKPILIETDFYHNTGFNLRRFLLNKIDIFIEKRYILSHIDEMNITTINDKTFMTYKYYITCPMPAVELKLNMTISKKPHLIKSVNRCYIHPIFQKNSYIR